MLAGNGQTLWIALRSSINHRFDYWCELVRPSLYRPVADYLVQIVSGQAAMECFWRLLLALRFPQQTGYVVKRVTLS